ncbi:hypothetical protein C0989_007542, partial [Termitomyces sp. Mn162]
ALLECLPPISAPPPTVEPTLAALVIALAPPVTLWPWIPHPMLLDTYDSAHSSEEHFLQSCLTYIHLSRDTFNSDMLKIAWVLSYMKTGHVFTYVLWVFQHSRGVGTFADWAAFERDFCTEFSLLNPAKTTALALHDREQYGQGKWTLDEYIDSFWALVKQATYPNSLQLCLMF